MRVCVCVWACVCVRRNGKSLSISRILLLIYKNICHHIYICNSSKARYIWLMSVIYSSPATDCELAWLFPWYLSRYWTSLFSVCQSLFIEFLCSLPLLSFPVNMLSSQDILRDDLDLLMCRTIFDDFFRIIPKSEVKINTFLRVNNLFFSFLFLSVFFFVFCGDAPNSISKSFILNHVRQLLELLSKFPWYVTVVIYNIYIRIMVWLSQWFPNATHPIQLIVFYISSYQLFSQFCWGLFGS